MTNEELRQRLVELLDELYKRERIVSFEQIAETFIANGVTIREHEESDEGEITIRNKNIKFNTGDYARIVLNESGHHFAIGTIVQLEKHETDYFATDVNGCSWWVVDEELESANVTDWGTKRK